MKTPYGDEWQKNKLPPFTEPQPYLGLYHPSQLQYGQHEAADSQYPCPQAYPHASTTGRTRKGGSHTDALPSPSRSWDVHQENTEHLTLHYTEKHYQTTSSPMEGKAGSHEWVCAETYTQTLSLGQRSCDKRKRGFNIVRGMNALEKRMWSNRYFQNPYHHLPWHSYL